MTLGDWMEAWLNPVTVFEITDPDDIPMYPAWQMGVGKWVLTCDDDPENPLKP